MSILHPFNQSCWVSCIFSFEFADGWTDRIIKHTLGWWIWWIQTPTQIYIYVYIYKYVIYTWHPSISQHDEQSYIVIYLHTYIHIHIYTHIYSFEFIHIIYHYPWDQIKWCSSRICCSPVPRHGAPAKTCAAMQCTGTAIGQWISLMWFQYFPYCLMWF